MGFAPNLKSNKEAIELVARQPNLYGDTTWVSMQSTLLLIQTAGIEKVMFGSDNPIDGPDTYLHNRHGDRSLYQDYFHVLPSLIPEESYEKLMWKNAARVFSLDIP